MSLSSASKVTIKNGSSKYEWTQTDESICVYIPIKNVLLKNIDIFYTECMIKINATSIKFISIIDFPQHIDYEHLKNRVQLLDNRLEVFLMKKIEGVTWDSLEIQGLSKKQVMDRRNKSISDYYVKKEEIRAES
jgi:hypothetical protein